MSETTEARIEAATVARIAADQAWEEWLRQHPGASAEDQAEPFARVRAAREAQEALLRQRGAGE
jgi:hypothetical protein